MTARLSIRMLAPQDAEALFEVRSSPEVARYQSWQTFHLQDAVSMIEAVQPTTFRATGCWRHFAIAARDGDRLVGDLALRLPAGEPSQAEIGFNISSRHWREGYGREAVTAFSEWLGTALGVRRVFAVTDERNHGCRQMLLRCGFSATADGWRMVFFKGEWAGELVYELLLGAGRDTISAP